jgi:agmatine/peptidylarginine deiminase
VRSYFSTSGNIHFVRYQSDDTWARDCSGITVIKEDTPVILDFDFNGWGGKFEAARDNTMTTAIKSIYATDVKKINFTLEGGAIDSNGSGSLLTTSRCLQNKNRNPWLSTGQIESILKEQFGLHTLHWLHNGYLTGDDTDSHIDTLARFIDKNTIMYLQCTDINDEHFNALLKMEKELKAFRDENNRPYHLIPLPMADAVYYENERLPATYANFLIINGAVLVPVYNDRYDNEVLEIFRKNFPEREVVGIDCSVLIRQHGSLHCVTMQFPQGVILNPE